ncbi:hypothetical protein ACQ4LE_011223 [Meloidogyne hapla]|uniref:Uncharacterized protein n=1 Tax=Meloidogyne hapla TaxID=6305 RepID=A0A1I8C1S1_MELHA
MCLNKTFFVQFFLLLLFPHFSLNVHPDQEILTEPRIMHDDIPFIKLLSMVLNNGIVNISIEVDIFMQTDQIFLAALDDCSALDPNITYNIDGSITDKKTVWHKGKTYHKLLMTIGQNIGEYREGITICTIDPINDGNVSSTIMLKIFPLLYAQMDFDASNLISNAVNVQNVTINGKGLSQTFIFNEGETKLCKLMKIERSIESIKTNKRKKLKGPQSSAQNSSEMEIYLLFEKANKYIIYLTPAYKDSENERVALKFYVKSKGNHEKISESLEKYYENFETELRKGMKIYVKKGKFKNNKAGEIEFVENLGDEEIEELELVAEIKPMFEDKVYNYEY